MVAVVIALEIVTCCNLDAYLAKSLISKVVGLSSAIGSLMTLISILFDVLEHQRVKYPIVTCDLICSIF